MNKSVVIFDGTKNTTSDLYLKYVEPIILIRNKTERSSKANLCGKQLIIELNLTHSTVAAACEPGRNSGRCVFETPCAEPAGWDGERGRDRDGSHMCAWTPDIGAGGWISSGSEWQRCALWLGASRIWGRGGDKLILFLCLHREKIFGRPLKP